MIVLFYSWGDLMKKFIAAMLSFTLILSTAACGTKNKPQITSDPHANTASSSSETEISTKAETSSAESRTPQETSIGPTRTTEAPDYGNTKTADLCELMHSITGKRVYQAVALVEDFFKSGFEHNYISHSISYQGGKGEDVYTHYYYMKISTDELAFNRFIFITNEEYGIVYSVEFLNSNSKNDNSLKPSEYTQDDMRKYYSRLEKDLTGCFGNPSKSVQLDDNDPYSSAYSVYEKGECTFRVLYNSSDEDEVSLTCLNNVERRHFIGETDLEPSGTQKDEDHIKPAGKDDIVFDKGSGLTYVKNQLLVSIKMGTPDARKKMEDICKEIGAEIVGSIELTSDYQIEFKSDKSYDELIKIGKELEEKYYFISSVFLNTVIENGTD